MKKNSFVSLVIILIFFLSSTGVFAQAESFFISNYKSNVMEYKSISEAQAASDLAAHFGFTFSPLEIMAQISLSDDPNTGYVGDYTQAPSMPPETYGVYQNPLAEALVRLDIPALGYEGISTEDLKNFIRSGYPVICWVVDHTAAGKGIEYTPESGNTTVVVKNMNTVTVTGFDQNGFTIWDNGKTYTRTEKDLDSSWKVLGYRALIIEGAVKASDALQWWSRSDGDQWKADQITGNTDKSMDQPADSGAISLQNLPRDTDMNAFLGMATAAKDPSQTVPEIQPVFSQLPNPEDYKGWFWYPEDEQVNQGASGISYMGQFGDLSSVWSAGMELPAVAWIDGFTGYAQTYNLDCETRSAVDLASFFGFKIDAQEFLTTLPRSDDPNEGFVGNYWDKRGQIPPNSYGVYQEPIAAQLRNYGFPAVGYKNMSWDQIRYEIANGRPVMVWVVGATETGTALPYTPANGKTTYVVPFQHTVVVIGYDASSVTVQDGGIRYQRDLNTFLASWAVLDNRGIIAAY